MIILLISCNETHTPIMGVVAIDPSISSSNSIDYNNDDNDNDDKYLIKV